MENILEKIHTSAIKFLEPLTPGMTFQVVVEEAIKLVGAKYGSIFLADGNDLVRVYASNPDLYKIKVRKKGYTYTAFKTKTPSVVHVDQFGDIHPGTKDIGLKSTIFIPLFHLKKPIGVLSIDAVGDRHMEQNELDTLKVFGALASLAIIKTQLYDETNNAVKLRDMFIEMAAHELRTPLTSIIGYVDLMQRRLDSNRTIEKDWVSQLSTESVRLKNMIADLLEMSQIKRGKMHFVWKECNIEDLINNVIEHFHKSFPNRTLICENKLRDRHTVIADPEKLSDVFYNILENAAKFSPENSNIEIHLKQSSTHISIDIIDYGRGMDEEEMNGVFNEYFRGKQSQHEGMGLGLFLAKYIILEHHGIISVESEKDKGTSVEIKLPIVQI
jgi:signal transduction histidine kinase